LLGPIFPTVNITTGFTLSFPITNYLAGFNVSNSRSPINVILASDADVYHMFSRQFDIVKGENPRGRYGSWFPVDFRGFTCCASILYTTKGAGEQEGGTPNLQSRSVSSQFNPLSLSFLRSMN
jgi:hypothetical protein